MSLKDAIYGFAVGDALGVPVEFYERDTYKITDMQRGGFYNKEKGTWSDDTSMTIATCKSIKEKGYIDTKDMLEKYRMWLYYGQFTPDGITFGIGKTTKKALELGYGMSGIMDNGNGSLMRILPLAFTEKISDIDIERVSDITHKNKIPKEICKIYVHIAVNLIKKMGKKESVDNAVINTEYKYLNAISFKTREKIKSTGYVVDTIEAVIWCFLNSRSYKETVLNAVNLGDDTDTITALSGGLAGIYYVYKDIPKNWISELKNKKIIDESLF